MVRKIDIEDNEEVREIMKTAIRAKFTLPELRKQLLLTGDEKLGENTKCRWGYYGENLLGLVLQEVRDEYRLP